MQTKIETRIGIVVLLGVAVFVYMGFQIGSFRFDRANYHPYTIYFKDISGLARKAPVKIAGVDVGWVESVSLMDTGPRSVKVKMMLLKEYPLNSDAHAIVRQDGLLGSKYLDIIPGNELLPVLEPGSALTKPSVAPVSTDELLHSFQRIADNIEDVSDSLRESIGGDSGKELLASVMQNIHETTEKTAELSKIIERSFVKNEDKIDSLLDIGNQVKILTDQLSEQVFPSFQESVEKIAGAFDRDFERVATQLERTGQSLERASSGVKEGFDSISNIAIKIDEGKGLLGKLINEEETYYDIKNAIGGVQEYFGRIDRMQLVVDGHVESMHKPAEHYGKFPDAKAYFEIRLYPAEDYFFMIQILSSEKGFIDRWRIDKRYRHLDGRIVDTNCLVLDDDSRLENVFTKERAVIKRNDYRFGLQIGKTFKAITVRLGMFDGQGGLAVDFDIPFPTDKLRWMTSFELYDIHGQNRLDDRRPHAKWINRMYIFENIYMVFGADDFVSRRNASVFGGIGLQFGSNDMKYLLSSFSGMLGSMAGGVDVIPLD